MKKVFTLLLLTLSVFVSAQNLELLHHADKCDLQFAKQFSDEIVSTAKTKYTYYASIETPYISKVTFIYIKDGLNDEDKKSTIAYIKLYQDVNSRSTFYSENCLSFNFDIIKIGANPDLEIKGTKEYRFSDVVGKFLDLFPFYQKNIEPTATTEKTLTTQAYSVRDDQKKYWYNFRKGNGTWDLKNMSDRFGEFK